MKKYKIIVKGGANNELFFTFFAEFLKIENGVLLFYTDSLLVRSYAVVNLVELTVEN